MYAQPEHPSASERMRGTCFIDPRVHVARYSGQALAFTKRHTTAEVDSLLVAKERGAMHRDVHGGRRLHLSRMSLDQHDFRPRTLPPTLGLFKRCY